MSLIDYRRDTTSNKRWIPWILLIIALSFVIGGSWWGWDRLSAARSGTERQAFYTVLPVTLDIIIQKDGELQAVKNTDIVCQVEGQSTIRTIVPEGTYVKKGDLLFELDSSDLRRKMQTSKLDVQKAESDLTSAQEQLTIQQSKNTADLEAATVELKLARLDLKEYADGKYPQQLSEARRGVQMAEYNLKSKDQALAQTRALFTKGFVTQSEVEKAQLEFVTAQNDFEKKSTDLKVLRDYTYEKDIADKQNKLAQAEKKVARVLAENASNLAQKVADVQSKSQALVIHRSTLEHYETQLANCTVSAPTDGIVLYGSSASGYFYRETPIQAGAKVVEQQLIVRLPDTSTMKAVARISEHQAVKLRVDKDAPMRGLVTIVGRPQPIGASVTSMSVLSDNMQRWWNPDLKEFPVDLALDLTPAGLKPGTSCSVEIFVERLPNVLAVPVGALYTHKSDNYIVVRERDRLVGAKVQIGQSNDTHVQILDGVRSGQQVVMLQAGQGREILNLPDELPSATTQPSEEVGVAQASSNMTTLSR